MNVRSQGGNLGQINRNHGSIRANAIPPILAVVGPAVKSRFRCPGRSRLAPSAPTRTASVWGIKHASPEFPQNVIERAVILSPGPSLQVPLGDLQSGATQAREPASPAVTLAGAEREHILGALRETGWLVGGPKGAAARLGMKRSTLYKKLKKLGIFRLE
ncbi:MAG: helix-turn-helix domain-containing protein [Thermoguttaceae bacterium]